VSEHTIVGIDPGSTGAIALIEGTIVQVLDLPTTSVSSMKQVDPYQLLKIIEGMWPTHVFIEDVRANALSYKSNFVLGHALGVVLTAAATVQGCSVRRIKPKEWQAKVGLHQVPTKERKNAHRLRAQELFPSVRHRLTRVADHNRADALLIAEAGRRTL
jgi:Holliday junction resolvasome RuvABC endonuclease subunit